MADVVDRDDGRVIEQRLNAGLENEPSAGPGVLCLFGVAHRLDRDLASDLRYDGARELAHASAPGRFDRAIAIDERVVAEVVFERVSDPHAGLARAGPT